MAVFALFLFLKVHKEVPYGCISCIGLSVNIHDTGGEGLKNEKSTPSRPES